MRWRRGRSKTGGSVTYAKGTEILGESDAGFAEAMEAAKEADVAVLALGESSEMSGEAGSRAHLDLPGNQEKLLEAVAATGRPIVLLVFSGRPLVLTGPRSTFRQLWKHGFRAQRRETRLPICCTGMLRRAGSCR